MNTEIRQLSEQSETVFNGKPWYGRGVMNILLSIDDNFAGSKRIAEAFTISQILHHMIAWKTFVTEKITGNTDYRIEVNSTDDWADPESLPSWREMLAMIESSQRKFLDAISQLTDDQLDEIAGGTSFTCRQLVQGAIHHDIYHIGQIGLLHKLPVTNS